METIQSNGLAVGLQEKEKTMRKTIIVLFLACAVVSVVGSGAVLADEKHGDHHQMTVRGEILDMACYIAHEAKGPDHAGCAKKCAEGGQPIGLLAEDGTVYLLYANHKDGSAFEAAKTHAGQSVELTGGAANRAGIKGIEVLGVKPL